MRYKKHHATFLKTSEKQDLVTSQPFVIRWVKTSLLEIQAAENYLKQSSASMFSTLEIQGAARHRLTQ